MTFDCFRPPCKNQVPTETSYCSAACKYPDWEARAEKAEARVAELEARDANGLPTHCVDRATWDEMGRALAAAANERDEALARVAELESALADERERAASCCVYIAEMMLECGAGDYPRGSRLRQAARMILEGVDKRPTGPTRSKRTSARRSRRCAMPRSKGAGSRTVEKKT